MRRSIWAALLTALLTACGDSGPEPQERPDLAVVEKKAGRVSFYSGNGRRLGEVMVGEYPHEAVLSADGKRLFVSDNGVLWMTEQTEGGNTISIIDVATMQRSGVIDLGRFRRPHGLALDEAGGFLYSTTENPFGLLKIDTDSLRIIHNFDVQGASPHMVTLGPNGEVAYVSNTESANLAAIRVSGGETTLIPVGQRPQGAVVSPSGESLYLTNSGSNTISIINLHTGEVSGEISTGDGPNRIAITGDGRTLVYSMQAGQSVGFADISTRQQTATIQLGGPPLSLSMTADGLRAFAGVQEQDKIFVISVPERKIVRVIETPAGSGPDPVIPLGEPAP